MSRWAWFPLCLAAMLLPLTALAQEAPANAATLSVRPSTVERDGDWFVFSTRFRDALDGERASKLTGGLPLTVVLYAFVLPDQASSPVSVGARSCRVVYDIWDEIFRIQIDEAARTTSAIAINVEGVLRRCAEVTRMPLVEHARLRPASTYFVAGVAEVNPIDDQAMERIKAWIKRSQASTGGGDSLFGSFVGLFVPRVDAADHIVRFRTAGFRPIDVPSVGR